VKLLLGTLCLNEMEHLPKLYAQHKGWPGLMRWVFVESADCVYAETNPALVTPAGLSTDGTSEWLKELAERDPRVTYIPYGLSQHADPAQGKVASRQCYLDVANAEEPEFVLVLDADEYYTRPTQSDICQLLRTVPATVWAAKFRQRHIWRPASIAREPLFRWEVLGGYWRVAHCRAWRWRPGMCYAANHNTPELPDGSSYGSHIIDYVSRPGAPQCIHLGFASSAVLRAAKHRYYVARGEGVTDQRQMYVDCRAAFESWRPGKKLPHDARVVAYRGSIPEELRPQSVNVGHKPRLPVRGNK